MGNMTKRPYTMRARAESAQATHRRILDAARALFLDHWYDQVTLEQVAEEAGVSKQTVLRRFGSKEGLFAAVVDELADRERLDAGQGADRRPRAGRRGHHRDPRAHRAHRHPHGGDGGALPQPCPRSSSRVGPPARDGSSGTLAEPPAGRARATTTSAAWPSLMDITSAQTWKMLRHDFKLSRKETERAVHELLLGVQAAG